MTAARLQTSTESSGSMSYLTKTPCIVKGHGKPNGVETKHLHAVHNLVKVLADGIQALGEILWCSPPAEQACNTFRDGACCFSQRMGMIYNTNFFDIAVKMTC